MIGSQPLAATSSNIPGGISADNSFQVDTRYTTYLGIFEHRLSYYFVKGVVSKVDKQNAPFSRLFLLVKWIIHNSFEKINNISNKVSQHFLSQQI